MALPPGPCGLPVVGSMLEYKGPQTNLKWAEQYGPIYYVRMGDKSLVYLNNIELVEKYMEGRNGEQFLDRPMGPAAFAEGLLFGSGENWKNNKLAFKRAMHTDTILEDMEGAVQSELPIALEDLQRRAAEGRPTRIGDALLPACANVVASFLLGGSLPRVCAERESLHIIVKNLEGVDLNSPLVQMSLKYPKMREHMNRFLQHDIVDVYGTSRRLQRLIRQWISQTRAGKIFCGDPQHEVTDPCGLHVNSSAANAETNGDNAKKEEKEAEPNRTRSNPTLHVTNDNASTNRDVSSNKSAISELISNLHKNLSPAESTQNSSDTTNCEMLGQDQVRQRQMEDSDSSAISKHIAAYLVPGNLTKVFVSSESLLTVPAEESRAQETVEHQVHFAALGFLPVTTEKQMPEVADTHTLLEGSEMTLHRHKGGRQMSETEKHDSVLSRLLEQPEFAGIEEDRDIELLQSLVDMFFGGVTTVLSALEFLLMYLSKNPTMQMLAQQEIARVLAADAESRGSEQTSSAAARVTWSMRERMPYLRACIAEALRLGCVTPSSLPHVACVETEIEGFLIPKGTFVQASIYSMHRDARYYTDPTHYTPQRHLDEDGKFCLSKSYRPFGIGARWCVGDALAEMELFIFAVAILENFNIISPPGSKKASDMETHMRIVYRLKNFECVLQSRG